MPKWTLIYQGHSRAYLFESDSWGPGCSNISHQTDGSIMPPIGFGAGPQSSAGECENQDPTLGQRGCKGLGKLKSRRLEFNEGLLKSIFSTFQTSVSSCGSGADNSIYFKGLWWSLNEIINSKSIIDFVLIKCLYCKLKCINKMDVKWILK